MEQPLKPEPSLSPTWLWLPGPNRSAVPFQASASSRRNRAGVQNPVVVAAGQGPERRLGLAVEDPEQTSLEVSLEAIKIQDMAAKRYAIPLSRRYKLD